MLFKKRINGCDVHKCDDHLLLIPSKESKTGALISVPEVRKLYARSSFYEIEKTFDECLKVKRKVDLSDSGGLSKEVLLQTEFNSWSKLMASTESCHIRVKNGVYQVFKYQRIHNGRTKYLIKDPSHDELKTVDLSIAVNQALTLIGWIL